MNTSIETIQANIRTLEGQLGHVQRTTGELAERVECEVKEGSPVMLHRPVNAGWEQDTWDSAELPADGEVDVDIVIRALEMHVELPEGMCWIEFIVSVLKSAMSAH